MVKVSVLNIKYLKSCLYIFGPIRVTHSVFRVVWDFWVINKYIKYVVPREEG